MPKLGCRERSGPKLNTSVDSVCVCAALWIPTMFIHFFCQTLMVRTGWDVSGILRKKKRSHGSRVKQTYDQASCHAHRWEDKRARDFCLCFRLSVGPGVLLYASMSAAKNQMESCSSESLRRNQRQRTHFSSIAVAYHGARKSFTADRFKKPIERLSVPARLLRGGGFHGLQPWHCARNMFQTRALAKPSVWFRGMKQGGALK